LTKKPTPKGDLSKIKLNENSKHLPLNKVFELKIIITEYSIKINQKNIKENPIIKKSQLIDSCERRTNKNLKLDTENTCN
jgi:hypothetical protein